MIPKYVVDVGDSLLKKLDEVLIEYEQAKDRKERAVATAKLIQLSVLSKEFFTSDLSSKCSKDDGSTDYHSVVACREANKQVVDWYNSMLASIGRQLEKDKSPETAREPRRAN